MPDINNSLAMQVNANPVDLKGTLGALSQIQLANAHAGLYGLQAQQEARKLAGFDYLKSNPTDYQGAIQSGLDPSVGSTLQAMAEKQRAMGLTPGGVLPESFNQLSSAAKNQAETGKIGSETTGVDLENRGKIAQSVLVDPTNDNNWANAIAAHAKMEGTSLSNPQNQQYLAIRDPNQRMQIAKAYGGAAIPPASFNAPHNVPPAESIVTPGGLLAQPSAPVTTNRAPVPSTNKVIGDDEAVRGGLYDPTPDQRARGIVPAAPNARVAGGFGVLPAQMTPRDLAAANAGGGEDIKYTAKVGDDAANAKAANYTLGNMVRDAQSLPTGRGMTATNEGRAWLQSFYDNVPGAKKVMADPGKDATAAYDSMLKNSGQLTRQALMQTHERAAVAYDMIQKQLPSVETSQGGLARVASEWQGLNDYTIAKQQVMAQTTPGGRSDKFDSEWNKNVDPTAFLLNRMAPQDRSAVISGLKNTPQGRATLSDIVKTSNYLSQQGL